VGIAAFGRNAMPCVRRAVLEAIRQPPGSQPEDDRPVQSAGSARALLWRMVRFAEGHLFKPTNIWVVMTTLVLVEVVFELAHIRLLLVGFCFYMGGLILRELAFVGMVVATGFLQSQIGEIRRTVLGDRADKHDEGSGIRA
jgi:hypothetical protein